MHKTAAGERAKALKKEAQDLASRAKAQKLEARLEDLHVWEQKKVKESKAGPKTYTYYLASWREGGKLRNVYLGSSRKIRLSVPSHSCQSICPADRLCFRS